MTKNRRVLAVRLGHSETNALEVKRWLDKWGVSSQVNVGTIFGTTILIRGSQTVNPGNWIVVDSKNGPTVLLDSEYRRDYGV